MIDDPNVKITDEEFDDIKRLVLTGASGADIYRAGYANSERQGRRKRAWMEDYLMRTAEAPVDMTRSQYKPPAVPVKQLRSCVFDIEVHSPSFGNMTPRSHYLVCCSFFPFDEEKPYTLSIQHDDYGDDRRVLKAVMDELDKFDFVVAHNGKAYDLNWLMTRIMFYRWEIPDRLFYYDTLSASRRIPLLTRKSLGRLIDFFRLRAEKTNIDPVSWDMLNSRDEDEFDEAIETVIYHCEQDVIANKALFDVLYRYDPKPSWKLWPF